MPDTIKDLLWKNEKAILIVGECKFQNAPLDKAEFEKFMDKIKYIPVTDPQINIFSLGGFTDHVLENSGKCRLISLDDMY